MTLIYYEYRPHKKRHGKVDLRTKDRIGGVGGFISVFGYGPATSEMIKDQNGTYGLANTKLNSDLFYLDFDDNDDAYHLSLTTLDTLGVQYKAYHTGGRGYHIHIPIEPIQRVGLGHLMKKIAEEKFPGSDLSLYKTSGMIRIEGTKHVSTGGKKMQVLDKPGKVLNLDSIKLESKFVPTLYTNEESKDALRVKLIKLMESYIDQGGRNNHGFRIAATCRSLELDRDQAEKAVSQWNSRKCNPSMKLAEVSSIINSAYRGV